MVVELPEVERTVEEPPPARFAVGDAVITHNVHPHHHTRLPRYARGKRGVIGAVHGVLENIRDHRGVHNPLYTVKFDLNELSNSHEPDSIWVDVHEEWLSEARRDS